MSSAGEEGRHRGDQGIDAWARHGVEEYDEREAMDRAERGLNASELSDIVAEANREVAADEAEHDSSDAGAPTDSNRAADSAKTVES